jgi:hypothetical protein
MADDLLRLLETEAVHWEDLPRLAADPAADPALRAQAAGLLAVETRLAAHFAALPDRFDADADAPGVIAADCENERRHRTAKPPPPPPPPPASPPGP